MQAVQAGTPMTAAGEATCLLCTVGGGPVFSGL